MSMESIVQERLSFVRGSLRLNGVMSYPSFGIPRRAVLICSPHPHFAGDMENNVIQALAENFGQDSVTLRFDYHGVGQSQIELPEDMSVFDYWDELEEKKQYGPAQEDIEAACKALKKAVGKVPLAVMGYSFGSAVGLQYGLGKADAAVMVGISPPLTRVDFSFLAGCTKPCLLIIGRDDFLYSAEHIDRLRGIAGQRVQIMLYEGADHFFRGREEELAAKVRDFLDAELGHKGGDVDNEY